MNEFFVKQLNFYIFYHFQSVVSEFLTQLYDQCEQAEDFLCYDFVADFINDCFAAIGLQCNFTGEQINKLAARNYPWPLKQIQIYSFRYNRLQFHRVELFLFQVANEIARIQKNHVKKIRQNAEKNTQRQCILSFTLEASTRMLSMWCNAFQHLKRLDQYGSFNHFDEPLARISKISLFLFN